MRNFAILVFLLSFYQAKLTAVARLGLFALLAQMLF